MGACASTKPVKESKQKAGLYDFISVYVTCDMKDMDKAKPIWKEALASSGTVGCMDYAFGVTGDNKSSVIRESYLDADSFEVALTDKGHLIPKLFAESCDLASLMVVCPKAAIPTLKPKVAHLGAVMFYPHSGFVKKAPADHTFFSAKVTFDIKDFEKSEPIMAEFVEATRKEEGNLHYGWCVSEDGKILMCREAYVNGKAFLAHLESIGPLIAKLTKEGSDLKEIALTCSKEDLEVVKAVTDPLGAKYYVIDPDLGLVQAAK